MDKKKKLKIIALLFIALSVLSMAAGPFLSSLRTNTAQENVELPSTGIKDYELSAAQENLLKQYGRTIIKIRYSQSCTSCLQQKQLLESAVNTKEFSGQTVLEEIKDSAANASKVTIESYLGGVELGSNFNQTELVNAMCEYVYQKPTFCLVKDI